MTTKEFGKWCEAQDAVRAWYAENPDKELPAWMRKQLEKTEAAQPSPEVAEEKAKQVLDGMKKGK